MAYLAFSYVATTVTDVTQGHGVAAAQTAAAMTRGTTVDGTIPSTTITPERPRCVATEFGDSGPAVAAVQTALAAAGYDPGPIDGTFGKRTQSALNAFFADHTPLASPAAARELQSGVVSTAAKNVLGLTC